MARKSAARDDKKMCTVYEIELLDDDMDREIQPGNGSPPRSHTDNPYENVARATTVEKNYPGCRPS
uniref:Uncharacterized protein n=1 Tax=Oryza nivara TaxID=4536 RepID=A0A0E0GM63_ORYNI